MVVENAERFGLSQLHQLRGRVGRGERGGICILIPSEKIGNEARQRMTIMRDNADGSAISEHDLKMRGQGEIIGTKQHGFPELRIADITKHEDILVKAREAAFSLIESDQNLSQNSDTASLLQSRWGDKLHLSTVG